MLAAGLSSGALSAETAEELAWNAALAAQGLSEEELVEIDDDEWTLSEEIAQSSEQLMAQAKGLANQQVQAKVYSETYAQELDQGLKNHEQSVKALREYQQELGMNAETFEALLVGVDAELSSESSASRSISIRWRSKTRSCSRQAFAPLARRSSRGSTRRTPRRSSRGSWPSSTTLRTAL